MKYMCKFAQASFVYNNYIKTLQGNSPETDFDFILLANLFCPEALIWVKTWETNQEYDWSWSAE